MRCVVQRTLHPAKVIIGGEIVGAIDHGLVVLVAFAATDTANEMEWMARKLPGLRIFPDDEEKMNRSLAETGGGILLVSQFTLYGNCHKGMRPSFIGSAGGDMARQLYADFAQKLKQQWHPVAEGRFAASMEVDLVNDGPVTLVIDRDAREIRDGQ